MDKASTDGEEQQPSSLTGGQPNLQPSNPYLQKLPSSPTGGLPNLQPSKPYLQKAALQPYRKPTHTAAKHPTPAAEATDAAEAIIRDYGITN